MHPTLHSQKQTGRLAHAPALSSVHPIQHDCDPEGQEQNQYQSIDAHGAPPVLRTDHSGTEKMSGSMTGVKNLPSVAEKPQ
jgi:hypothetical protein